jgi:hypothetical protein
MDEVADSSWFTNRLGARPFTVDDLRRAACEPSQLLLATEDPPEGSWVIDKGKDNGSSPGFRVRIPGKGKYMLKSDDPVPERPSAASVMGAAAYTAVGFNFSCEQVVYVKRTAFRLMPGLTVTDNSGRTRPFDQAALDRILERVTRRGEYLRFQASAWLEGRLIGPFRYEKTRDDDPNDIIPHQNRRELRGGRVLAAWLDHFDAREQNSMDVWRADRRDQPDSSPGHVVHYYLDTSDCLGSEWDWEQISRRLGYSYVVDWNDVARDFVTLGIPLRPWDRVQRVPGQEMFGFFDVTNFVPEEWKNEYANPAFERMTERDAAWMARILARFTPEMIKALVAMGQFSDASNAAYLERVLQGRLDRILERYLARLSPIANLRIAGANRLCGVDLAELRGLRAPASFRYSARLERVGAVPVERGGEGELCAILQHVAPDGDLADDDRERYVRVRVEDGFATGPLVAHLYDLGPVRGFRLVGLERLER